jgi:hypothetical protein
MDLAFTCLPTRMAPKIVTHAGAIDGFKTSLIYVPDRRIAVVVLSNVSGEAANSIADQLLTVALGQ